MKVRKNPSSTGIPEDSPGFLLWQLANAWQRRMRQVLAPLGLTYVQAMLLSALVKLEEQYRKTSVPITQGDLARFCRADATMTSQVLRTLESKGLLERSRGNDARARLPNLTVAGRSLALQAMPVTQAIDEEFFALGQAGGEDHGDDGLVVDLRALWGRQADQGYDA
ncbi:MAG: MarR family winged helix-turn-helix transcriptional regulator [Alphaproteobacteria bacterium]|nr:MarR family winged helix-turn-helix transcriptional regulator [Alphaproteobacteria bacterium]MBU0796151.1 MarR family winged helix-turn-helix transcriptional regulator [Alphaproteobacteria bacterium]MBU0888026.1 MarR family winged helix-turn-helix transcriptional regulator [Alphaproteobacteria bacterium]MBU1813015.1 MarR family winged helix-turn-helix transcriptional regulator [Alphaproteobacteria bacterium]MBU2089377.1 MarR family winged helix-turn-helix transcriptional regulator [Alphaprot